MTRGWWGASRSRRQALAVAALCGLAIRTPVSTRAQVLDAEAHVAAMTPREQAALMLMLPISGTMLTTEEEAWLRSLRPGGVILVGSNFGTPEEVRSLVASIHDTNPDLPPLVALDQEGGLVGRIVDDPAPGASALGQFSGEEIASYARARADALAGYGFDVNFAPVADVAFTEESFMTGRVFGSEPGAVSEDVVAYLEGVAGSSVLHCVKHFPGHGRVSVDSHLGLPVLDVDPDIWWEEDALPFRAAIDIGVPMVMLGHLAVPGWDELPASLSPETVRVLREDLAFGGVVVSDDLGMGALDAWGPLEILDLAVAAGVDLLLYVMLDAEPNVLIDHLVGRVERGEIAEERITESASRLVRMRPDMRP